MREPPRRPPTKAELQALWGEIVNAGTPCEVCGVIGERTVRDGARVCLACHDGCPTPRCASACHDGRNPTEQALWRLAAHVQAGDNQPEELLAALAAYEQAELTLQSA